MKTMLFLSSVLLTMMMLVSCSQSKKEPENTSQKKDDLPSVSERIKAFVPVKITADLSHLSDGDKKAIEILAQAGHIADEIYWMQTSPDAVKIREELKFLNMPDNEDILKYVMINYGPYDRIYEGRRFAGKGPEIKPPVANFYPQDLTKEEFETYIKNHPEQKEQLESPYTVVVRQGNALAAKPYHEFYSLQLKNLRMKLLTAAQYAENETFKKYLNLRADALMKDDYFESDMAWMDIKNSNIDLVIGPIENYEDELFNYKTAFECVIMVKDIEATKELETFEKNIDYFEHNLPYDKKYIRKSAGKGNILQIVNVAYFGGDCQKAVKTIAASLPNDPKVHELKGGKKSMYKNMMEAKFDKIVVPIAEKILEPSLVKYTDKKAFTSFVTLHEVSHTLGRSYVYGNDKLDVRRALKERFSAIEETKADILGMYNHKHLLDLKLIDEEYMKKAVATYIAGLYRSIRFGAEAHGQSNLVQLNFLREKGAIVKLADGKYTVDNKIFFEKVAELAKIILTLEAEGNYAEAGNILNKYGKLTDEIKATIDRLKDIPRDLDTSYEF